MDCKLTYEHVYTVTRFVCAPSPFSFTRKLDVQADLLLGYMLCASHYILDCIFMHLVSLLVWAALQLACGQVAPSVCAKIFIKKKCSCSLIGSFQLAKDPQWLRHV